MTQENLIKTINGKLCVSTAFLAQAYEVSPQAVALWEKKGCPKIQRGYWCLPDVIHWREDTMKQECDIENLPPAAKKLHWEAEHKRALTESQRLKNQVAMKEYLSQKEVTKELASFFITLKQSLMGIPRAVRILSVKYIHDSSSEEAGKSMEKEAKEAIEHALEQWAKGDFTGAKGDLAGAKGDLAGAKGDFSAEQGDPAGEQEGLAPGKEDTALDSGGFDGTKAP